MIKENTILGFTLIELLLVLGISSVLLVSALALPAYWVKQNQFAHHANQFLEALAFARSHAMISGRATTICSSDNAVRCTGTAYEKAWIVFAEAPNSINGILDHDENILMVQKVDSENISIRSKTFSQSITYNRFGQANYNGRFILCARPHAQIISELVINKSGRVRLAEHRGDGQLSAGKPNINNCLP